MHCCDRDAVVLEAARARLRAYYRVLKKQNILVSPNKIPPDVTSRELRSLWFVDLDERTFAEEVVGEGVVEGEGDGVEAAKGWIQVGVIPKSIIPVGYKKSTKWRDEECDRLRLEIRESQIEGAGMGLYTRTSRTLGSWVCSLVGTFMTWFKASHDKSRRLVETVLLHEGKPIIFNMAWNHPASFANDGKLGAVEGKSRVNCVIVENDKLQPWDPDYLVIRALGDLRAGTELFLDYGDVYWNGGKWQVGMVDEVMEEEEVLEDDVMSGGGRSVSTRKPVDRAIVNYFFDLEAKEGRSKVKDVEDVEEVEEVEEVVDVEEIEDVEEVTDVEEVKVVEEVKDVEVVEESGVDFVPGEMCLYGELCRSGSASSTHKCERGKVCGYRSHHNCAVLLDGVENQCPYCNGGASARAAVYVIKKTGKVPSKVEITDSLSFSGGDGKKKRRRLRTLRSRSRDAGVGGAGVGEAGAGVGEAGEATDGSSIPKKKTRTRKTPVSRLAPFNNSPVGSNTTRSRVSATRKK